MIRTGPHGVGTADTDEYQVRPFLVLPAQWSEAVLRRYPDGRVAIPPFHPDVIAPGLADPDAAAVARAEIVERWWRQACTDTVGGLSWVRSAPAAARHAGDQIALNQHVARVKTTILNAVGVGGPGLTTAAFNAGMANMQATLEHVSAERLRHEAARAARTFTSKNGEALAQRMYRLCNVANDVDLPDVHQLLARASGKSQDYSIIQGLIHERTRASPVPLPPTCAPLPTTKLVDEVFRNFCPGGNGLIFGQGLTPFAIVCDGQAEVEEVRQLIKNAEITEGGSSVTLNDAQRLTSSDIRFPAHARAAEEKLYGFSIVVDLFHGVGHPVAVSIRTMACRLGPHFHRLVSQYADNAAEGMDLVCRVLFDIQQDYFGYVAKVANGDHPAVPNFERVEDLVVSFRVDSLAALPAPWYNLIDAPCSTRGVREKRTREESKTSPRTNAGARPVTNPHADERLVKRFKASGHKNISDMTKGHDVQAPTQGGQETCMTWACKGECNTNCKRAKMHIRYNRDTLKAYHGLMDTCGVANPQE